MLGGVACHSPTRHAGCLPGELQPLMPGELQPLMQGALQPLMTGVSRMMIARGPSCISAAMSGDLAVWPGGILLQVAA